MVKIIEDHTDGKLMEAILFAHSIKDYSLLDILERYASQGKENENSKLVLYPDFVDYSFQFAWMIGDQIVYNGGIIYHGSGKETFTVSLTQKTSGWSVHT